LPAEWQSGNSPTLAMARLCNFQTGDAHLLPSHKNWISKVLLPAIRGHEQPSVNIIGYASHLWRGPHRNNLELSWHRCEAVKSYIRALGLNVSFPHEFAFGEGHSGGSPDNNDGFWRRVTVYAYAERPAPPPPEPAVTPLPSRRSRRWRARLYRGAGASALIAEGDVVVLQIVDDEQKQCGLFLYIGGGITVGVAYKGMSVPGSTSNAGDFVEFTTKRPVFLSDFSGKAELFQPPDITVGPHSAIGKIVFSFCSSRLRINSWAHDVVVEPVVLPTGSGLGIQLFSGSTGVLREPARFDNCCGAPGGKCSLFK
jgi:hypothetical protein